MLVCHCAVVSDRTIRAAIADGAMDVEGVAQRCGAGVTCGGCHPGIEALLAEAAFAIREPQRVGARQAARRRAAEPAHRPTPVPAHA